VLLSYQAGLITCTRDELRRDGFSAKHLQYLAHGLPVLAPEWRRHPRHSGLGLVLRVRHDDRSLLCLRSPKHVLYQQTVVDVPVAGDSIATDYVLRLGRQVVHQAILAVSCDCDL
jgi:hypothetical protein